MSMELLAMAWNFAVLGIAAYAVLGQHRSALWILLPLVLFAQPTPPAQEGVK